MKASSPPAMSMTEASSTLDRKTSKATPNVTSLQASPDGPMPCDLPDGLMTDLFGQALAPANLSPQPEKAKHQAMNATSGPTGSNLSGLADRQSSLANRLKRQLDGVGSTLFTLTWRQKATPLGRPYYQLAASGRRISDSDSGSPLHWTTPQAHDSSPRGKGQKAKHGTKHGCACLATDAEKASWATPAANQANGEPEAFLERKRRSVARGSQMGVSLTDLQMQAKLASWPTPTRQDAASSGAAGYSTESGRHSGTTLTDAARASWPTPNVPNGGRTVHHTEGESTTRYHKGKKVQVGLESVASWATPSARDFKNEDRCEEIAAKRMAHPRGKPLSEKAHGMTSSGSPAQTESKGQLNPAFSLWLMGYPPEWLNCAPLATRSRPKPQRSS
jgi:hypothetical protein